MRHADLSACGRCVGMCRCSTDICATRDVDNVIPFPCPKWHGCVIDPACVKSVTMQLRCVGDGDRGSCGLPDLEIEYQIGKCDCCLVFPKECLKVLCKGVLKYRLIVTADDGTTIEVCTGKLEVR